MDIANNLTSISATSTIATVVSKLIGWSYPLWTAAHVFGITRSSYLLDGESSVDIGILFPVYITSPTEPDDLPETPTIVALRVYHIIVAICFEQITLVDILPILILETSELIGRQLVMVGIQQGHAQQRQPDIVNGRRTGSRDSYLGSPDFGPWNHDGPLLIPNPKPNLSPCD